MRQGCLQACSRIQPANALNLRISQLWEAGAAGVLEKMGRKTELSGDSVALDFWKNGFYSPYTLEHVNLNQNFNPMVKRK